METTTTNTTTTTTTTTTQVLAARSRESHIDIWDSSESIRIYQDRTIHKSPCRAYSSQNSWGLGLSTERITGTLHKELLDILAQEVEDGEEYTDRMFDAIHHASYGY